MPKDMAIEMRTVTIFGGSEDKRSRVEPREGAKSILRVQGTVLFGGLEIKD
ncbi:MAG: hypothetical protein IBX64_13620 [Actinobacteria bacterium]|nr:hypothetical protein [Actinomycetota bacterium]